MRKITQIIKSNQKRLVLAGGLIIFSGVASAAPLDFTNVTAAIDASTIVAAIATIAAVKILPGVAKWGFNKVINWF